jgi:hypothetical protein
MRRGDLMAVESNGNSGFPIAPPVVANGTGAIKRRKRPSSLTMAALSLPSVETSLEEFIARANQTLVDAASWDATAKQRNDEETKQREADALRMKVAEHQLREGEAREASLRRQLDAVQGKLAEAEARAALASTSTGAMQAAEALVADLRGRLERSEAKLAEATTHTRELEMELAKAKTEGVRPSTVTVRTSQLEIPETLAVERMKVAEAKAMKALAAARAASAGLTVSPADLAAIESGLVVTDAPPRRGTPWLPIAAAFVTGLALMFGASRLLLRAPAAAPDEAAVVSEPHKAPIAAPAAPTVTPIEPPAAAAPAAPTVTPIESAPAAQPTAAAAPAPMIPATVEVIAPTATPPAPPAPSPAPAPPVRAPAPARVAAQPSPAPKAPAPATRAPAKSSGGLADPFATTTPAPAKQPAKAAPTKQGIADPFAN